MVQVASGVSGGRGRGDSAAGGRHVDDRLGARRLSERTLSTRVVGLRFPPSLRTLSTLPI